MAEAAVRRAGAARRVQPSRFVGVGDLELDDLGRKIHQLYGLDVSEVEGGNLLQIFGRIATIDSGEADD